MKLNFSDERYKNIAMASDGYAKANTGRTVADAFMMLIKDIPIDDLSNLCKKIQCSLEGQGELTLEACYDITQGKVNGIDELVQKMKGTTAKDYLLKLAYECLEKDGLHLGEKTIAGGKINTSAWISHSLYEVRAAQTLANKMGLNPEKAGVLAILHDYGRKYIHDFTHVIKGFETLTDLGWNEEARACLTHSFINAGRCANCDSAEEGFYIDEKGEPEWGSRIPIDDMAEVLATMRYDDYDTILNIADLMATDKGITTPYDRVQDVATRKTPDPRNRAYFLSEFTNKLLEVMNSSAPISNARMSIEEADKKFKKVSEVFYRYLYPEKRYKHEKTGKGDSTLEEID